MGCWRGEGENVAEATTRPNSLAGLTPQARRCELRVVLTNAFTSEGEP